MQSEFPATSTIAEVLPVFYSKYGLGADGGLSADTVKIVFFKNFYVYIPNIDDRRKAVLKHDIHHIITGYKSDFPGEHPESQSAQGDYSRDRRQGGRGALRGRSRRGWRSRWDLRGHV